MTKKNKPVREPSLLILLSLAESSKHGYAIIKDVEELSQGRIRLSNGTLYGALVRMQEQGWIERHDEEIEVDGRPRVMYTLKPNGKSVLDTELDRISNLMNILEKRLGTEVE